MGVWKGFTKDATMGLIQFQIETDHLISEAAIRAADFITFDGRVIPAQSVYVDGVLKCTRQQSDSSRLRIQCHFGQRNLVIQTSSLRESPTPYRLEVELARGELSRLRNYYSIWTGAGLKSTPELDNVIEFAHHSFRKAIFSAQSCTAALDAIEHASRAIDLLVQAYTSQRITFRQQRTQHFPMSVGCRLTKPPLQEVEFLSTFNSVLVKTRWKDLEPIDGDYQWGELDRLVDWAAEHRLFTIGGPLLDLTSDCFPNWMAPWKGDLINLLSFTSDFVETVVGRYVGRIRHWEVVCGGNCGGPNDLSEEQRLNLVAKAVEAAEAVDEQIQISVRIIQPWGEYLSETRNRLSPIQFVDTLRRSGVRISEVNLDLRFGGGPLNSLSRDMLNVSQLLDQWSLLHLPLQVMAALPDASAFRRDSSTDIASLSGLQTRLLEDLFLMCLSKERVTGFYCLNWADDTVKDGRLVDDHGELHPIVRRLSELEETHWPCTN